MINIEVEKMIYNYKRCRCYIFSDILFINGSQLMGQSYVFRCQVRDEFTSDGSRTHTIFVQNCRRTHVTYNNINKKHIKAFSCLHHCVFIEPSYIEDSVVGELQYYYDNVMHTTLLNHNDICNMYLNVS